MTRHYYDSPMPDVIPPSLVLPPDSLRCAARCSCGARCVQANEHPGNHVHYLSSEDGNLVNWDYRAYKRRAPPRYKYGPNTIVPVKDKR